MKKILITSALPYVNNVPHLGNLIGCVLSADVFARYARSRGWNTRYICGTDEHGTTTEVKALEEGLTPKEVCDKYYAIHKNIYDWFGISFDEFGRTSSDTHKKITQELFKKLHENGFVVEDFLEELYCEKCQKSLADRFVEGSCPFCSYQSARGDQCDKCGHLLNATELKDPKCKVCGSTPAKKNRKHLFLDLVRLQPELEAWVNERSIEGSWSENTIRYTKAWLAEGLKKRCISRQLKWGIPIPLKGFEDMVFYVWFDAPIGYISITANKFPDWKDWWKNPDHVRLYQFMGKDNVPFHSILFPATLLASREKYALVHHISTTEYLNYEDSKFSKSRRTGVFGDDCIKLGIPPDVFRYYLLVNRPEKSDTVFSWEDFQEKLNNELLSNLGNFVNRTLVFLSKYYDSTIPAYELREQDRQFLDQARDQEHKITELLENVKLKDALREVMALSAMGNKFFQENEPWKNVREDRKRTDSNLYLLANLIKDMAILVKPYLPFTSNRIFKQLNMEEKPWDDLGVLSLEPGHHIGIPEVLFSKMEDADRKKYKEMFAGKNEGAAAKPMKKEGFALLNLRVARIKEAKDHPKADKLMVIKLDLGGEERQIVAGIKGYYPKEELIGKNIVIVSNLKPALLRGEESQGMLLACHDGEKLGLLTVKNTPSGKNILVKGITPNKDQITIEDFANIALEARKSRAYCNGMMLVSEDEEVLVERDVEGRIR